MTTQVLMILRRTGVSLMSGAACVVGYRHLLTIDRPVWVGACLMLATLGTVTGFMVIQRVRSRRKEHRVESAPAPVADPSFHVQQQNLEAVRGQWKAAMHFLRRSGLKKRGNPLYVLPWYLLIGAEGAGKTTALRSAGLPSFASPAQISGVGVTEHCEWSFFEQAILIDTAGRYTVQAHPEQDAEEWRVFLDLLLKHRRREPLNGLVLAVSADQLLTDSSDMLENFGKILRKRIDELMRGVGAKFPVYVLITKSDRIPGMARFCQRLSGRGLEQAMGCLNHDGNAEITAFLNKTCLTLSERLKNLRLILAAQPDADSLDPELLVLPETFGKLRTALGALLRGAFQENLYQETPFLRGLFFSSGTAAGHGAFLHDLFAQILPSDRTLSVPTHRALSWRKGTWSLSLIGWVACMAALCGLLSYSFMRNMKTLSVLRNADEEFSHLSAAKDDVSGEILMLDRLRQTLLATDRKNSGWLSDLGLRDVAGVETAMKRDLSAKFRRDVFNPADAQHTQTMAALSAASSDELFSQYVAYLVSRLSVLRERLDGRDLNRLSRTSLPVPSLRSGGRESDAETKEKFGQLYIDSEFWTFDTGALKQEMTSLQAQLKRLLALKGNNPRWLIVWAASQNSVPPATLSEAWKGHALSGREPSVPGLFSLQGKAMIDTFFQEIEKALNDPAVSGALEAGFERWYHDNAFQLWHQFIVDFPRGQETLPTADAWRQTAGRMAGEDGPYALLLKHLMQEFEPVAASDLPSWMRHVRQIRELQKTLPYLKYRQALEKTIKAAADPAQVIQATIQAFDTNAAPEASAFPAAFDALAKLKASAPRELAEDTPVWRLISGPMDFLWEGARRETATHLQMIWQSKVLSAATGLDSAQGMPVLLAKDGPVMGFAKDQAAPFVQWTPGNGFCAKTLFGGAVPFTSAFFPFMNGAVWVSSVNNLQVSVTALSPETNAKAKRIPHIARLTLRCGGAKDQVLQNRRLRVLENSFNTVEQSFAWTPACTETRLEIDLAGSHLTKSYPGPFGFFAFLHDFKDGQHTLTRNDFPEQAKALAELGVDSIAMHYRIKGAPNVAAPKAAPARIAWSWNP